VRYLANSAATWESAFRQRKRSNFFRIAQEATANVCKRAGAQQISIALSASENTFRLEVSDDGVGFDLAHPEDGGIGLYNMRQRARAVGGTLGIESKTGAGTKLTCIVPDGSARVLVRFRWSPRPLPG
jgi:signal transduction histidine kinase